LEKSINDLEKEIMLEAINAVPHSPVLDSEESYYKAAAECIKILGIKKDELYDRQLKAYLIHGDEISLIKDELLIKNDVSEKINLGEDIDQYLKT
jgi:hypothetical protein